MWSVHLTSEWHFTVCIFPPSELNNSTMLITSLCVAREFYRQEPLTAYGSTSLCARSWVTDVAICITGPLWESFLPSRDVSSVWCAIHCYQCREVQWARQPDSEEGSHRYRTIPTRHQVSSNSCVFCHYFIMCISFMCLTHCSLL